VSDLTDQVILSEVKLTVWDMYRFTQWAIWWRFRWLLTITAAAAVWFVQLRFFGSGDWKWSWWNVGVLALFTLYLCCFLFSRILHCAITLDATPTLGALPRTPSQRQESPF